jgi:CheY-like chemotaxis protein
MKKIEIIALIDDDDTYVYISKRMLKQIDTINKIEVFGNGLDGLNYLKLNIDNPILLPEIIFLDLSMPIMDGWQFLEEFINLNSSNLKKIIIYICSSSISPYDIDKAKSLNVVTGYIIKPLTKEDFTKLINDYQQTF